MKKAITTVLAVILLAGVCRSQDRPVVAERIGNRIDVTIGGAFFTSYRFEDDEKYPFFFPVNGPATGGSVTSMRNGLYPHHSSLFFGCDLVNGGNYWQEGLERGRIVSLGARVTESGGDRAVIEDECIWKRPDAGAPVMDRRRITISSPSEDYYQIDFDIDLEMLMDVTILKTNHSLLSVRMDKDLSVEEGGTMVSSNGDKGESGTFGVPASWIDCYGKRRNCTEGIAIMEHPSSAWYPSKWFTRDYGFMSPTPLYWPADDVKNDFRKGEVISLKYRIIVHKGTVREAGISGLFEEYCR